MDATIHSLRDSGERLLPTWEHISVAEHLHRYALATSLASGKRVLDIASGEGYGSRLLGSVARNVLGVDRSPAAVVHATRKYGGPSVRFLQADATRIPCRDAAFDLVVSFETIEHLLDQDAMMAEIRRVLTPDGLLVMSSPERANHGEKEGYVNEFHVLELYGQEFLDLVGRYFPHVAHLRQQVLTCSALWPAVRAVCPEVYAGSWDGFAALWELRRPAFHVIVAGNAPVAAPQASLFDGTELAEAYAARQATEIVNLNAYVAALRAELDARESVDCPQEVPTIRELWRKLFQLAARRVRERLLRLWQRVAAGTWSG